MTAVTRDRETEWFFDGTARGELLLLRDRRTGEFADPRDANRHAPAEWEHVAAAGSGTVVSWSRVPNRHEPDDAVTVGLVRLDEGILWPTRLVGFAPEESPTGARVHLRFMTSGESIPYFVPA